MKSTKNKKKEFNKNSFPRGKKRGFDSGKEEKSFTPERKDIGSSLNDISWYSRYPELLASAARIPMPYKPGMLVSDIVNDYYNAQPKFEIPGVMALWYMPSIGRSTDSQSPATIMAKELWARIRSKFSADLDADAPDIMMYALELDQIHAYLAWLKRLYRSLTLWSPDNRDFPDVVLYAMGLDDAGITLLHQNQMAFYGRLNTTIRQANKFLVPDDMDLYHRHRWMNENVYGDEDSPMAQMYLFNPAGYWRINTTSATALTAVEMPSFTGFTDYDNLANTLFQPVDEMISAMSDWGDAYTINGYIERAFEGASFYGTALINYDEKIAPVYSPEVLSQIENARIAGGGAIGTAWDVTQDPTTNTILHTPRVAMNVAGDSYINLHTDVPTAADITIATRLCVWADRAANGEAYCGTEVVVALTVHGYRDMSGNPYNNSTFKVIETKMAANGKRITTESGWNMATASSVRSVLTNLSYMVSWRHHPVFLLWWRESSTANYECVPIIDMHNFNFIPHAALAELHKVCVYSEFNCFRQQ